ncbi:GNAT family N-acetyltransferase [Alteribacter lacisalsi]|uniref:GNAT family N-acetyltransferase n=1 Tax=Alteribacter lacisalsi TaxID=2045244 RepID=A0A2W0HDH6_9BACI|nr:GNAT family N-acetyltransferase [Alteribacter lacisalsi]PYZ98946.1 GNAT family N-acetyltransferase [Alteribacter lacisalsi]
MTIIRLTENHAEELRRLRHEALQTNPESFSSSYEEEKQYPVERYRSRLASESSVTLGFYKESTLSGLVSVVRNTRVKTRHRADIFGMYVTPAARGNGTGRRLMEEAIKKAWEFGGVEQLYLTVVISNTPALKLYESLGFEAYGREEQAIKIGSTFYDEQLMVLRL